MIQPELIDSTWIVNFLTWHIQSFPLVVPVKGQIGRDLSPDGSGTSYIKHL